MYFCLLWVLYHYCNFYDIFVNLFSGSLSQTDCIDIITFSVKAVGWTLFSKSNYQHLWWSSSWWTMYKYSLKRAWVHRYSNVRICLNLRQKYANLSQFDIPHIYIYTVVGLVNSEYVCRHANNMSICFSIYPTNMYADMPILCQYNL